MSDSAKTSPEGFEIKVAPDRMSATVVVAQGAEVSASDIIAELRKMKIARFDDGLVIEALDKRKTEALSINVAQGIPPVDDKPCRVEYWVPVADGLNTLVAKVEPGQVLASIAPAIAGTDGKDVFGEPIPRKAEPALQIGRNLKTDKGKITATLRGNLRLSGHVLSAEPLLEIRGETAATAPVIHDGDAVVKGSLNEGHSLQISGSLSVAGAIEAVQLKTGGAVHIQGGILGKQKGKFTIGGGLRCRFITGGLIVCAEDIHVQSDLTDSRIACAGKLTVAQGVLYGGTVAANGGITCGTLGHPSGAATTVEAGAGIASRSFLVSAGHQIDLNRKRIKAVRATIEPLVQMMKSLNAQQREKVTELLYEADEMEAATLKMEAELESQTARLSEKECAEVMVAKVVYPGVTVRFPFAKTTFNTAIKGPFKLVPHKSGAVTEIVLIDLEDQSRTVLPTSPVDPIEAINAMQLPQNKAA